MHIAIEQQSAAALLPGAESVHWTLDGHYSGTSRALLLTEIAAPGGCRAAARNLGHEADRLLRKPA